MAMWNFVKTEINKQNNNKEPPLNMEGTTVTDYHELASIFNDHFINTTHLIQADTSGKNSAALVNLSTVITETFPQINLTPVTAKEIKNIINSLKWKNSSGYDEIPPRILKISIPYITSPLTYLCNKSLNTGIFPTWLKYSQVIPIFKKGSKTNLTNYRPMLTSFSKIFEKVIYKRLDNHVICNNILAKEQHGFRNNTSTEKAIYQLTNNILKALDNEYLAGGIFCDLTKAFDCVENDILLNKLEFYGIKGNAYKLIRPYLINRYQRVAIRNKYSNTYYSD